VAARKLEVLLALSVLSFAGTMPLLTDPHAAVASDARNI
jgi:hypothetical protein